MNFEELGVKQELADALKRLNITEPTDVQREAIPPLLSGKDVIVRAKTGTGKTLAFLLPILQNLTGTPERGKAHVLILAPTRELALQTAETAVKMAGRSLNVVTVYGGASINVQMERLDRGADIVVGTPGRVIDLMDRGALNFDAVKFLVLDEADIMLDMGFIDDVEYILARTPDAKQSMLCSATMPNKIIDISKRHMHDARYISVGEEEDITVKTIKHMYSVAYGVMKFHMLLAYIESYKPAKAIIFLQTQREADLVHDFLRKQGFDAVLMHGGLTQASREHALSRFKQSGRFLIATNVASRGLDIKDITDVINFDVPDSPYVYVHRVGRSARMGKNGRAFTIVSRDQLGLVKEIEYDANIKLEKIFLDTKAYEHIPVIRHARPGFYSGRERRPSGGFDRGRQRYGGHQGFNRSRGHNRHWGQGQESRSL
ncbi:MAG: DEAD/DEAH box helicase [Candidatus Marsarchaeota archaeon]|nr:DEAD/DEAH box helicase [Candidatus Marsarchaeota archaeon]